MDIKFLLLTHRFQNGIKHQNGTRIGELLLIKGYQFSKTIQIEDPYEVKHRQFRSYFTLHIFNDLNFSASCTVRLKFLASRDWARLTSAASNLACDLSTVNRRYNIAPENF